MAPSDQQAEVLEHCFYGSGSSVVPGDDALGGVAAADELDVEIRSEGLPALHCDFDEEALFGDGYGEAWSRVCRSDLDQHFGPLFEGRAVECFVRIDTRYYADHLVNGPSGGGN